MNQEAVIPVDDAVGELAPQRRFRAYPEYQDSGVEWLGELPVHWRADRLKWTVTMCRNGIWGDEPDGVDDLVCVRVADFDRTRFIVRLEKPTFRSVTVSQRHGRLLGEGDLLLEKSGGGDLQPVGVVILFDQSLEAVCSNFVARMPVATGFDGRFLAYFHAHLYSGRVNTRSIKQTTGIQNLDSDSYLNEHVPYIPLPEQRAIAAFLDRETARLDELIAKKQRLVVLLAEKRTALISHAVTKGLNPDAPMKDSGIDWLGKVPEHWDIIRASRILQLYGGFAPEQVEVGDGPVCYFKVDDLNERANEIGIETASLFVSPTCRIKPRPAPIILIPKRGAAIETNKVRIARLRCLFDSNIMGITSSPRCDLHYLALVLLARRLWNIADISTIPQINNKHINPMRLPLPPINEQEHIVNEVLARCKELDQLTLKVSDGNDRLHEYRSALISAAVTGKIDVRSEVN